MWGVGGWGGRERTLTRLRAINMEPNMGLELINHEILTWAKTKGQSRNGMSHPAFLSPLFIFNSISPQPGGDFPGSTSFKPLRVLYEPFQDLPHPWPSTIAIVLLRQTSLCACQAAMQNTLKICIFFVYPGTALKPAISFLFCLVFLVLNKRCYCQFDFTLTWRQVLTLRLPSLFPVNSAWKLNCLACFPLTSVCHSWLEEDTWHFNILSGNPVS